MLRLKQATLYLIQASCIALVLATPLHAEVYRWVDENGKVHFGDRKPEKTKAEEISENISKTNIDTSSEEAAKMGRIFAKETEAEKKYRQQQIDKENESQEKQSKRCERAKEYLETIQGPVYFVDDDGREFDISEKERVAKVKDMQAKIKKYCRR